MANTNSVNIDETKLTLRQLRLVRDMKQTDVFEKMSKTSATAYARKEKGLAPITVVELTELATIFNKNYDDMIKIILNTVHVTKK